MTAVFEPIGAHRVRARLSLGAPQYWPTWAALGLLRLSLYLPLKVRGWLAARLGDLYYRVNRKRRRIATINVALCFPHWTPEQQTRLVHQHFRTAALALFHIAVLWWGSEKTIDSCLRTRGLEYYQEARAAGRRVIVLHCHAVGLETSLILSRYFPYVGFIKPLKNPVLDFVMTRGRERFGGHVYERSGGLRPLIRAIQAGYGASYVPDEDLGPKDSVYAPFFGVPAATLPTLGRMARMTEAVVIPCFTKLLPEGGSELWLEPPLSPFPTGSALEDATVMNAVIERGVRTMPEQYMWTMKRFKTRDDGVSLYD